LWTPVPEVAAVLARMLSGQTVPAGLAELVTLS
jgi:hypothetical protein